jgi:hypothetical protein
VGRRRGLTEQLHALALQAYDQIIGLQLEEVPVDGCITKAPGGGEVAGRSPVDRGKQGRKRSIATEGAGIPLGLVAAGANRHDSPLLGPTLQAAIAQVGAMPEEVTARLDRGDDSAATRMVLAEFGFAGEIAHACGNSRIRGSAASTIDPAGARSYLGGPSAARARFTVFLETPITLAIALIGIRSARSSRRISAQSSTPNTPLPPQLDSSQGPGRGQLSAVDRGQFSPVADIFSNQAPARATRALLLGFGRAGGYSRSRAGAGPQLQVIPPNHRRADVRFAWQSDTVVRS